MSNPYDNLDLEYLISLRETYTRNLNFLEKQRTMHGLSSPLHIINEIKNTESAIQGIDDTINKRKINFGDDNSFSSEIIQINSDKTTGSITQATISAGKDIINRTPVYWNKLVFFLMVSIVIYVGLRLATIDAAVSTVIAAISFVIINILPYIRNK